MSDMAACAASRTRKTVVHAVREAEGQGTFIISQEIMDAAIAAELAK